MTYSELLFSLCGLAGIYWGVKIGWQYGLAGIVIGGIGGALAGALFYLLAMGFLLLLAWLDSKRRGEKVFPLGKDAARGNESPQDD